MERFLARHADRVIGVLSGFDRLVFRGTMRTIAFAEGMGKFLSWRGVLLKDFGPYVEATTGLVKKRSLESAEALGRPVKFLPSSATSKEDVARSLLAEQPVEDGLICVLTSVEPCMTFEIHRSRERKRLELVTRQRKCLFLYHYFLDRCFGFLSARLQTWFPFSIQICLNGREFLARQMDRLGIEYLRRDNCFPWIEDIPRAQRLAHAQLRRSWPPALDRIANQINPARAEVVGQTAPPYYWSVHQSEWATDVMFDTPDDLAGIYPSLVKHAITHFASPDVLRFLGRRVHPGFEGELTSHFKDRPEGLRLKHTVGGNSIKIYDKQGSVLRTETTINTPNEFKVYRPKEGGHPGELAWRPMRKGVADLHRRAKVSQAANNRYLEALASVDVDQTVHQLVAQVLAPAQLDGRTLRPLAPWSRDLPLLQAIFHGEFAVNGFRNRDIVALLHPAAAADQAEARRRSAAVTRLLRILRAHGVVAKVNKTYRYQLTLRGRQIVAAVLATRSASVRRLNDLAA